MQYSAICYPETVSEVCGWHSEAGATDSRTELRRRQGGGRPQEFGGTGVRVRLPTVRANVKGED